MKAISKALMILGIVVVTFGLGAWLAMGANMAWTKTYITIPKTDPITAIDYVEKVNRFIPGIDLLIPVCGAGITCVFAGLFIFRKTKTKS